MKTFAVLFALVLMRSAGAALDNDPYVYDPSFNGGVVLEDRFAATTLDTSMIGLHLAKASNGDVIAAGLVPSAFQSSPPHNLGLVRYGAGGERVPWASPTPIYSFFANHYVDFPNSPGGAIGWVHDLKIFRGYIYVLVDIGLATGNRDVRVVVFDEGGAFVESVAAFTTGLDETGASLVPYCFFLFNGGPRSCKLIATANYVTSSGRQTITMKRFEIAAGDGTLTVDNSFGISNNGAMDQIAPNSLCDAGSNCSWSIGAGTALRTDTSSPTIYLTGDVVTGTNATDALVVAVNGYDGSLSSGFGAGSGIYVNYTGNGGSGSAVIATTLGNASTDVVYLASNVFESCGIKGTVTKLRAQVALPGGPFTDPDIFWANGGTRDIGGNPGSCGNVYTSLTSLALDGDRLAVSGYEYLNDSSPSPVFSIVRVADGTLTEFARAGFPATHADGTPWGGAAFYDIVADGSGRFTTTGYLYDASANNASLFGSARFASDRIFGDGLE
ncbi:MAG: hypothetical protein ABIR10_05730 [Dokdonella sp.]